MAFVTAGVFALVLINSVPRVQADITTGLISWINPTNATSPISDSSGNGNDMNLINSPTFTTGPNGLGALNMLGGPVQLGFINFTSAFNSGFGTWSYWEKTTSNGAGQNYTMFDMANSSSDLNGANSFMDGPSGIIFTTFKNGSGSVGTCATQAGMNDGNWHLITITWSQSSGDTITCYQDASFGSATTLSGSWSFDGSQPITINYSNDTFWQRADASYADMRVYTRILSSGDITQLFNYPPAPVVAARHRDAPISFQ